MGKHRINKRVKRTNRKQQQRELKASWRILLPGNHKTIPYLVAEDAMRGRF